ncbi:MAG: GreA/GreB family elongation factor [Verrucomicrobiales bacterium]
MSKAFTREDDDAPERAFVPKIAAVPPGVNNYITAEGAARLRAEMDELESRERPRLALEISEPGKERALALVNQRIATLAQILSGVTVVEAGGASDKVKFGSWVKVKDTSGDVHWYRIAGIHETELDEEWISWMSPLAKGLMNRSAGEKVMLKLPKGLEHLEILEISETAPSR